MHNRAGVVRVTFNSATIIKETRDSGGEAACRDDRFSGLNLKYQVFLLHLLVEAGSFGEFHLVSSEFE